MGKKHPGRSLLTSVTGLWIMAIVVALSIEADLDTSLISSVPSTFNVVALTIIMHCAFITLQLLMHLY